MWWNVQQKSFLVVQSRYCKVGDTEQQSVTSKWENFLRQHYKNQNGMKSHTYLIIKKFAFVKAFHETIFTIDAAFTDVIWLTKS